MMLFVNKMKKQPLAIDKWDNIIWSLMVEKGIVHKDESITLVFYNKTEIKIA